MLVVRAHCLAIAGLVVALSACSSIHVTSDYSEDTEFSQYRTFDWLPVPQGLYAGFRLGPTMDNRIRRAIESELVVKGLQKVTAGMKPDLHVVYHAALRQDIDRSYYDTWGYRRPRRWGGGTVVVERQSRGTLVVDLVDAGANSLVWRGSASGVVKSPEEARKRVFEAIERIFSQYPPP